INSYHIYVITFIVLPMYNKSYIFKSPLTPETFRNSDRSFAISKPRNYKTSMYLQKPFHKHNSKKASQESQLYVNASQNILNNITELEQSKQELPVQKFPNNKDSRIFYNKFSYIIAMHKIGSQIPDKYEIEMNLSGLTIKYKTKYQQTGNISYKISWINSY
ncbi:11706_t:CDS:2, partial [Dentiscutata heterogama]